MAVKQIAFEIPELIQQGIDNGTLIRFGGVIRDQAGHIVEHLKEVPLPKTDNDTNKSKIMEFAKKNKYFLIGTVVVTAVAAGITYIVIRNNKNREEKIPKCVADFNKSFTKYFDSIRKGNVSEEKVDEVMLALEEIKKNQDVGNIHITFSVENINILLEMIRKYTIKFAEANSFKIPEDDFDRENEISSLLHYLKIQKQVFERCA